MVFSPLTESQIVKIIELSMKEVEARLAERDIKLVLTDAGKKFIADEAYDPNYGARPVKRYMQKNIETELASMIIKGDIVDGATVEIDAADGNLKYSVK